MAEERFNIYRTSVHWRHTMSRPTLMFFDARLILFVGLFGFHIRWWTFIVLVVAITVLSIAKNFNYSIESMLRLLRSKFAGPNRSATSSLRLRPMLDYGNDALHPLSQQEPEKSA